MSSRIATNKAEKSVQCRHISRKHVFKSVLWLSKILLTYSCILSNCCQLCVTISQQVASHSLRNHAVCGIDFFFLCTFPCRGKKNIWLYTSTSPYAFMVQSLLKLGDNFTLLLLLLQEREPDRRHRPTTEEFISGSREKVQQTQNKRPQDILVQSTSKTGTHFIGLVKTHSSVRVLCTVN
jgi:hypothetical protein